MTTRRFPDKVNPPMCTVKQMAVLKSIVRGNNDGSLMDIYQLMTLHGQGKSRAAMRCTLGHLEAHGLIERAGVARRNREGRPRRLLAATDAGRKLVRPRNLPSADGSQP